MRLPLCAALAAVCLGQAADPPAVAAKPNLVVILADDVGLGDVHCSGGPYPTPNIDALAAGGTRFAQCYAMPLCGPSRCMLLTGRYPFRTGLISNRSETALEGHHEVMLPTVMRPAGYVTACVGKWGQMPFGPREWGFDGCLSTAASGRYLPSQDVHYDRDGEMTRLAPGEYLPDLMHRYAVDFMQRNRDKPFLLYYPMEHIHGPILPTPDSKPGADERQLYADNVAYMDKLVGALMAELDRLELRQRTLVLFLGDNGTARFGVGTSTVDGKAISGAKASMLEGGSRVPLIANWPGTTPAGAVRRDLIDLSDILPTLAELGGAALPAGVTIDGRSFAPQLRGEAGTPREWVYVELEGRSYVRDQRYKLTNAGALFDLRDAPFAETPVTADDEATRAERARLQAVLDTHPALQPPGDHPARRKRLRDPKGGARTP